ncbi:CBS domain-containing protein, partial [Chloroflexota bacterium]
SGKLVQYDTPEAILARPANKFVHDFVGTDRALKRLSRISIKGIVKHAPSVSMNTPVKELSSFCKQCRWIWVVDDDQRLIGWIDRAGLSEASSIKEAAVRGDPDEIAVANSATLRETLSRMLGQGLKSIPVVDDSNRFIGEVALSDIEAATAETEA